MLRELYVYITGFLRVTTSCLATSGFRGRAGFGDSGVGCVALIRAFGTRPYLSDRNPRLWECARRRTQGVESFVGGVGKKIRSVGRWERDRMSSVLIVGCFDDAVSGRMKSHVICCYGEFFASLLVLERVALSGRTGPCFNILFSVLGTSPLLFRVATRLCPSRCAVPRTRTPFRRSATNRRRPLSATGTGAVGVRLDNLSGHRRCLRYDLIDFNQKY